MKPTIVNQENRIIQIELFEYQILSINQLIKVAMVSSVMIAIGSLMLHYFFNVEHLLIYLSLTLIIIFVVAVGIFHNALFTDSDIILIIAFGEFQLMKNKNIIWCEKIEYIDLKYNQRNKFQIPMITIKGITIAKLSIGYGRPKNANYQNEIDYFIFSKLDWEILKRQTKQVSHIERVEDKTIIKH